MTSSSLLCLTTAALSFALLPKAALADSVSLTLTNTTASADLSGGTANYYGTISAASTNTGTEYLNGDSYSIGAPFTFDDSGFINNAPLSLTAGQSYTGLLFDLVIPANSAIGAYSGSFSLLGGGTAGSAGTLATANFTTAVTPEPSTWLLLGTGVLGMGLILRRRNTLDLSSSAV